MPAEPQGMLETILVIDDNAQNRQLMDAQLSSAGYTVTLAASGEEALALFSRYTPDLVLLDIMMPGLNGFEVFRRMRQLSGGQETPIVFLTGAVDPTTHRTALELGVDDFLSKPINRTELLIRVRSLLRVRRLHTELSFCSAQLRTQREAFNRTQRQIAELKEFMQSELQPPLLHAMWLSDKIIDEKNLTPPLHKVGRELHATSDRLQRTIGNVVDIDRAEAGILSPQQSEFDLNALVTGIAERYEQVARLRRQKLHVESDLGMRKVVGDSDLLMRLLENLLDHVLRSAPEGGVVNLEARTSGDGNSVYLRVHDDGEGVPIELRDALFDRNLPLPSDVQNPPRSDSRLGLSMCRLIAEAHGGRVYIEERKPKGTAFCVQLPLAMGFLVTDQELA